MPRFRCGPAEVVSRRTKTCRERRKLLDNFRRQRYGDKKAHKTTAGSLSGEVLKQGIEIFETAVFNDDSATSIVVFDCDLETKGALQAVLDFANVGVDGRLGFGLLLDGALRMQKTLDVVFRLANRKRKCKDALRCLFHLFGVFEGEQGARVAKTQLARLNAVLNARREPQKAQEVGNGG